MNNAKGYAVIWEDANYNTHDIEVKTIEEALNIVVENTELGYDVTVSPIF